MNKYVFEAYRYALVICRNNNNKYLVVKETNNRGWWIPGGKVEREELFYDAGKRQCEEEAGIKVDIKGIIRVDYGKYITQNCWRAVFYAEPQDQNQIPKQVEDMHTKQARFLSFEEILALKSEWRGPEIYEFPKYLEEGGVIYPVSIFAQRFNNK